MSMEQELRSLLRDRAERVRVDGTLRQETLLRTRRSRAFAAATTLVGVVSVVVIGVVMADSLRNGTPQPAPVDRPSEDHGDEEDLGDDEEPTTDVLIAKAKDDSWRMYAGVNDGGETLCFSLEGVGCTTATLREPFVRLTSFDYIAKEGFLFGPVRGDVATLDLVTSDRVIPLRLRDFPEGLGVDDVRFYVKPLRGEGSGVIVARDEDGSVLQEMELSWGQT